MKNFINVFKNKVNKDILETIRFYSSKNILKTIEFYSSNNNILLHWYDKDNNFGDQLNLYLLKNLFNINVFSAKNIFNYNNSPVFSVIGSILDNANYRNLEIWGSGFMYKNSKMKRKPKKIYAVRGPLTRQNFINNGIDCPIVYGDPGILISEIYNPKIQKKYKLGIIPHYVDKGNEIIANLFNKYPEDIKIIDIQDNIENVIDNIKSCEYILSSSLDPGQSGM